MMQLVCPPVSLIKEYACHFADEPNTGQFAWLYGQKVYNAVHP